MRLHYNGLRATLAADLDATIQTIVFANPLTHSGGTPVPNIVTNVDYLPLVILSPTGQVREIVHVTAYASGASTATISRGREGTVGVTHTGAMGIRNAPLAADFDSSWPAHPLVKTGSYTANIRDLILADATAGALTITLPAAPPFGAMVSVQKVDASGNGVTVTPAGGGTIHGETDALIADRWAGAVFEHQGSNVWSIASQFSPVAQKGDQGIQGPQGIQGIQGIPGAPAPDPRPQTRLWTPKSTDVVIDEFADASLDPAWVKVDPTGKASYVTWTEDADCLSVYHGPQADASSELHCLLYPLAGKGGAMVAGDAIYTAFSAVGVMGNYTMAGLVLADGTVWGSGKQVISLNYAPNSSIMSASVRSYTNFNGQVTIGGTDQTNLPMGVTTFQRLVLLAGNIWRLDMSTDGVSWVPVNQVTYAGFAPTHAGFLVSNWGSAIQHMNSYNFLRRQAGVS